jgi:hypothetical protein
VDEDELNEELDALEQEQLDNKMLKTGTVPVSDEIHRLPAAANGESKCSKMRMKDSCTNYFQLRARHLSTRKRTRRKNSGNYRQRWQCRDNLQHSVSFFGG